MGTWHNYLRAPCWTYFTATIAQEYWVNVLHESCQILKFNRKIPSGWGCLVIPLSLEKPLRQYFMLRRGMIIVSRLWDCWPYSLRVWHECEFSLHLFTPVKSAQYPLGLKRSWDCQSSTQVSIYISENKIGQWTENHHNIPSERPETKSYIEDFLGFFIEFCWRSLSCRIHQTLNVCSGLLSWSNELIF
jgi:hypothetical protein